VTSVCVNLENRLAWIKANCNIRKPRITNEIFAISLCWAVLLFYNDEKIE